MIYLPQKMTETARRANGTARAEAIQWTDGRRVEVQSGPGICYLNPEEARRLAADLFRAAREAETGTEAFGV